MTPETATSAVPIVAADIGAIGPMRVGQWLVRIGERVSEGDRLVELLADGVLYVVPSPASGLLTQVECPPGSGCVAHRKLGLITPDAASVDTLGSMRN